MNIRCLSIKRLRYLKNRKKKYYDNKSNNVTTFFLSCKNSKFKSG